MAMGANWKNDEENISNTATDKGSLKDQFLPKIIWKPTLIYGVSFYRFRANNGEPMMFTFKDHDFSRLHAAGLEMERMN